MEIQEVNPMERLNREELRERIDDAMDKLSDNHRTVLVLYEYEQIEYKQIAEKMGTSIGTVMSRLFYARKKMAALLGETLKRDGLIE
jgi:RNA polymerase sigma-70 factor (ECF subfamily)